jgi:hypothetical protein
LLFLPSDGISRFVGGVTFVGGVEVGEVEVGGVEVDGETSL